MQFFDTPLYLIKKGNWVSIAFLFRPVLPAQVQVFQNRPVAFNIIAFQIIK